MNAGTTCGITYRLDAPGEIRAGDYLLTGAGSCYRVEAARELAPGSSESRWRLECIRLGKRLPPHYALAGLDAPRKPLPDGQQPVRDPRWWPLQWDRRGRREA